MLTFDREGLDRLSRLHACGRILSGARKHCRAKGFVRPSIFAHLLQESRSGIAHRLDSPAGCCAQEQITACDVHFVPQDAPRAPIHICAHCGLQALERAAPPC